MTAQLIDGNQLAKQIRADVAHRTAALKARGVQPQLNIILVGDDPASQVYTKHKVNDSTETGLGATLERYPANLAEEALLARIRELNADPKVHGILVQLPLPKHMDSHKVIETIAPAKDVDGFHVASAGALIRAVDRSRMERMVISLFRIGSRSGGTGQYRYCKLLAIAEMRAARFCARGVMLLPAHRLRFSNKKCAASTFRPAT